MTLPFNYLVRLYWLRAFHPYMLSADAELKTFFFLLQNPVFRLISLRLWKLFFTENIIRTTNKWSFFSNIYYSSNFFFSREVFKTSLGSVILKKKKK